MKSKTIRFLKQGLVTIDMPDNLSIDEQIEFAKNHLDTMSDQDLVMAMSDCTPSGNNPSRFDSDSFQVEALEDPDNNYELLYYTNLWEVYLNE